MIWYFDLSELGGCVGILANPGDQVVYTGTVFHTEPVKYRGCEAAARFARENDLHFWFGEKPELDIYTVPKLEIGGFDNLGGLFAGSPGFALGEAEPLYYIDREHRCYRITGDSREFPGMGMAWRERMVPTEAVEAFESLERAREKYTIFRPKDDEELFAIFRHMDEVWEGERR